MTMTAAPRGRHALRQPAGSRQLRLRRADLVALVGVTLLAAAAGLLVARQPILAFVVAALPGAVILSLRPKITAIMLGLSLPFAQNVAGGSVGVNVALSDLLLVVLFATVVIDTALTRDWGVVAALRPVALPVGQYVAIMLVILAAHFGPETVLKTGQRLELFVAPLLVGAYLARRNHVVPLLKAYIFSATLLAIIWPGVIEGHDVFGIQKNPAGQFMANAILLLVAVKQVRPLLPALPVLVIGLLFTQSRGAILSVAVGLFLIVLFQPGRNRGRVVALLVPLVLSTFVGYRLLPKEAQERTITYRAGEETSGARAIEIRQEYREDANLLIRSNPHFGVGVGQYRAGESRDGTETTDPHQVLLLQAAEGGWPLALSFVGLTAGTVVVAMRLRRRSELAATALAVNAAIVSHGFVDVYWVRATPVLGWLLLGMAVALQETTPHPQHREPRRD